jgi:hypothetical protein
MREIEITIDQNGNAEMDFMGFHGKGCDEVSKELSRALGKTIKTEHKAEYFKAEQKQKQKIMRGM